MKAIKQKHGKESTIGKIIYGFLLFMPLLAIAVTCAYVIFNKNAYKSYYGENINEEITKNTNVLKSNQEYTFNYLSSNERNLIGTTRISVRDFELVYTNSSNWENSLNSVTNDINTIYFWVNTAANNQQNIQFYYLDNNEQRAVTISLYNDNSNFGYITFNFTPITDITISNENAKNNITYIEYNSYSFLSSAFYYAVNEVKENRLFNWSYNTATYNVLETTCNTLGITNSFVPMMLSYWLMISLMYLLYDIALLVVHMAHNRIHDIESSI